MTPPEFRRPAQRSRLARSLWILGLLASRAASAAPGDLSHAFGHAGVALEPAPVGARPAYASWLGSDPGPAVVVTPDGSALLARSLEGRCTLERLATDGLGGLTPLGEPVPCSDRLRPEVSVAPGGDILFLYAPDAGSIAVQRRRPDGSLAAGFGIAGTAVIRPVTEGAVGRGFALPLDDGGVMIAVNGGTTSTQSDYSTLLLVRLARDGSPAEWGAGGVVRLVGFEWGPLGAEGVGIVVTNTGVTLYGSGNTTLYGGTRSGFFYQRFTPTGGFYPYFAPEWSLDSALPIVNEFNDGSLAALFVNDGALRYDGPALNFGALPAPTGVTLRLPGALTTTGSRVTPLRFRPLPDGGLLLLALHEEPLAGAMHGRVVLARFLADGQADAGFGHDGVATLDFALGGAPFALPQMISAPTLVGQDRVVIAAWGANRLGVVSLQARALAPAAGSIGWQARDRRFVTDTDATDATLRFRVARHGGRQGAASVTYRSRAPAELSGRYAPVSGRLDWPDGDDTPREIALTLRPPPVDGTTGIVELVLEPATSSTQTGSTVQQIVIADYSGGTLAFDRAATRVDANAGTVRLGVTRSGGTRGAITATVRIPLVDGTVSRTVNWADGESGPQQVELPFDARWNHFLAELDAPPRTRLGSPSMVAVQVATASTTTVASTTTTSGTSTTTPASTPASGSSGGGALDAVTLTWLLAALLASASRVAGARRPRPGWPFPRVSDGRTPASRRRH